MKTQEVFCWTLQIQVGLKHGLWPLIKDNNYKQEGKYQFNQNLDLQLTKLTMKNVMLKSSKLFSFERGRMRPDISDRRSKVLFQV